MRILFRFLLLLSVSVVDVLEVFSQQKSDITKLIFSRLQYVKSATFFGILTFGSDVNPLLYNFLIC